jgi:hypothetical protein
LAVFVGIDFLNVLFLCQQSLICGVCKDVRTQSPRSEARSRISLNSLMRFSTIAKPS